MARRVFLFFRDSLSKVTIVDVLLLTLSTIIVCFAASYLYYRTTTPYRKAILKNYSNKFITSHRGKINIRCLIEESKNVQIKNASTIEITTPDLKPRIVLFKRGLSEQKIYEILIDGEVVRARSPFPKYQVSETDRVMVVGTGFAAKPASYTLSLIDVLDRKNDFGLDFIYHYNYADASFPFERSVWYEDPKGWIKQTDEGILLSKASGQLIDWLQFKRLFEKNAIVEFNFVPLGSPLNLSLKLGKTILIIIGDGDNKTVRMKQTKMMNDITVQEIKSWEAKYKDGFSTGEVYKVRIEKDEDKVLVIIDRAKDKKPCLSLHYEDSSPDKNLERTFKSIIFGLWKNSRGVILKEITIKVDEKA